MPRPAAHGFATFRADIAGLRAIAVLAVVIYHALPVVLPGGFIGVDVFFVISGYLISGQIIGALRRGDFSLTSFYARRIRRIFPALILVLVATIAYGFVILLPAELAALGADTAAGAAFVANLLLWQEAGYFDRAAMFKPLLHLWSLGVEEQFYIFWPVALALAQRAGGLCFLLLAALTAASLLASVALGPAHPTLDFYSPFTRLWELGAGAMLAWRPVRPRHADALSVLGLGLVLTSAAALNQRMVFPGYWALLPVLGTLALLAAGAGAWVNRQLLSRRAAVYLGGISYPLYLWHWPLLSYAYFIDGGRLLKTLPALGLIALALALAAATTRWIERPLRFGAHRRGKTIGLAWAMCAVCAAGFCTWTAQGLPARFPSLPQMSLEKINAAVRDGVFAATPHMRLSLQDGITIGEIGDSGSAIMFTGDSMLFEWDARVEKLFVEGRLRHRVYFVAGPSCRPYPGVGYAPMFSTCNNMAAVQARVIAAQHITSIIIGARWPDTLGGSAPGLKAQIAGWIAQGYGVTIILPAPHDARFDPALMIRHTLTGFAINKAVFAGIPDATLPAYTAPIAGELAAIARQTGAATLDPRPDICGPGPSCSAFFDDGAPKFADENHLRPGFVSTNINFLDALLIR